jgi:hypothetical protein
VVATALATSGSVAAPADMSLYNLKQALRAWYH